MQRTKDDIKATIRDFSFTLRSIKNTAYAACTPTYAELKEWRTGVRHMASRVLNGLRELEAEVDALEVKINETGD